MTELEVPPVPPPKALRLSKSKFLSGLQCHKRLYLEVHHPSLATKPDEATQAMFDMGTEIGELARSRFQGGVLVTAGHRQTEAALAQTAALIQDLTVPAIFEAAFLHGGVLIRADILERVLTAEGQPCGWRLIEVKSSTKVKDVHLEDLAIQSEVILGAGLTLVSVCLMHINTGYLYRDGAIDLMELFAIRDLPEAVAQRRAAVRERLATMNRLLLQTQPPNIEPDQHCHSPYDCPFWEHCTKDKPARWIHFLPGSKQVVSQLTQQGVTTIDEIPAGAQLSPVQRRVKENVEWVSAKLGPLLKAVQYPVHHLDFETVMLPVPRFSETRPYQALPVQWSNHIEQATGELRHEEFLHKEVTDPRRVLAESLLESLGERGSICVYSPYERSILEQLAIVLPSLKLALSRIVSRLWDLHPIIKDHYYHPAFGGSYSIKSVLPAMVPSLAYDDLAIKEGAHAASQYYRMVFVETDWIERAAIEEALLRYCARDTLAMVELRRALKEKAQLNGETG
jgi:CRISPR/Cas system-associated exonuclease Cas4 (RecB family)